MPQTARFITIQVVLCLGLVLAPDLAQGQSSTRTELNWVGANCVAAGTSSTTSTWELNYVASSGQLGNALTSGQSYRIICPLGSYDPVSWSVDDGVFVRVIAATAGGQATFCRWTTVFQSQVTFGDYEYWLAGTNDNIELLDPPPTGTAAFIDAVNYLDCTLAPGAKLVWYRWLDSH